MPFTETIILTTDHGELDCSYFHEDGGHFCLVIFKSPWPNPPFVRMHSSCLFSESLHSNDCDCALQLDASLKYIASEGGIIVYLFQEGRGIGLEGKMKAINIERTKNVNTAEAFEKLGFSPDPRVYDTAVNALRELGVPSDIMFASNNRLKIEEIERHGFNVVSRLQLEYKTNPDIDRYLAMKAKALHHYEKD